MKKPKKQPAVINLAACALPSDSSPVESNQNFDRMIHAWMSKFIGWLSPASLNMAYFDWWSHFSFSPAKQQALAMHAIKKIWQFIQYTHKNKNDQLCVPCVECRQTDQRFKNPLWQKAPFNFYSQWFLICEHLWNEATTDVRGVSQHHQNTVNFMTRQLLDMLSPSNFPWTNPQVIQTTLSTSGNNIINGFNNLLEDITRYINDEPPVGTEQYQSGVAVAITPGKVIYRNHLIELIQYTPTSTTVYPEPILIVPAWIMKYYILDLSPHNSMVKYLVDAGHTVFMISWRNPTAEDRDIGLEDYVDLGIMHAINAINHIIPDRKIHSIGYCIGGTLLAIAAAAMAGKSDDRLQTITLFAAEVDFKDAGELLLFIDESQLTYLEDIMWEKGYLDGSQMAGTFSMLHSIDLIWSRMVHHYLLGERKPLTDLMAWDYDTTRLPYKMHTEYLRNLFLSNDLAEERFKVDGKNISLFDLDVPIFAVSTALDHVAPWKSVYKIHYLTSTDITFVLTGGGHNSGIISEPHGFAGQNYQMLAHAKNQKYHLTAEVWQEQAPHYTGSWWIEWQKWLASHSKAKKIAAPAMGNAQAGYAPLCDAPGTYICQK